MTMGAELPCPKCGQVLDSLAWHDAHGGACRICRVPFEFIGFPALTYERPEATPKPVVVAEHATCFHHPENQAESVCEGCGRVFNIYTAPADGALHCDKCGGEHRLIQRPDDREEVIGKRLEVFEAQTKPLIKHYQDAGLLRVVDADASVDTVFKGIQHAVGA